MWSYYKPLSCLARSLHGIILKRDRATNLRGASEFMSDEMGIEKIDLDKVDWRGSRDFFESLGEALDKLDDKDESYDFTWVGKRKSIIEAGAPINKTLRPDVANSKNWDTKKTYSSKVITSMR